MTQTTSSMTAQTFGPGELLVIAFPHERIPPIVVTAVRDVIADGVVTLLDVTLIRRSADGGMEIVEVESQDPDGGLDLDVTEVIASGLVGDEDLAEIADDIEPGTSALVVLLEHTWARAVTAALHDAGAELVGAERISAEVMNDVALAATP